MRVLPNKIQATRLIPSKVMKTVTRKKKLRIRKRMKNRWPMTKPKKKHKQTK